MADPFRLRALFALTDAMRTITVENGYHHELADSVFRGRSMFMPEDPLPLVTIMEPPQAPDLIETPDSHTVMATRLGLLIQGFAEDDRENPTDPAYRLMADVQMCLARERKRGGGFDILGLGQRCADLQIGQGVVRAPDALVSDTAFFWLPVVLELGENLAKPFD